MQSALSAFNIGGVLFGKSLFLYGASGASWMCRERFGTTCPPQGALGGLVVRALVVRGFHLCLYQMCWGTVSVGVYWVG